MPLPAGCHGTAAAGAGRVTTVGTVPDAAMARALLTWLAPSDDDPWHVLTGESLTVTSATNGAARRLRVVHNWSWVPVTAAAPVAVRDVLSGVATGAGEPFELGAWDVRVVVEE